MKPHEYPYTPVVCARCVEPIGHNPAYYMVDGEGNSTGQLSCEKCAKSGEKRAA